MVTVTAWHQLRERESRHILKQIIRLRLLGLIHGDDVAEVYLTLHFLGWAAVLSLPGSTMNRGQAWRVLQHITAGDPGLAAAMGTVGALLVMTTFRLITNGNQLRVYLAAMILSVGLAIGMFLSNPLSVGPIDDVLTATVAWLLFLRTDRV
jgi:hypothetical protein